jgi:hypothetical protein
MRSTTMPRCMMLTDNRKIKLNNQKQNMIINFYNSFLVASSFIVKDVPAQRSIDSFVNTLHNTDAKSAVAWVAPTSRPDSTKIYVNTFKRILITHVDIRDIKKITKSIH